MKLTKKSKVIEYNVTLTPEEFNVIKLAMTHNNAYIVNIRDSIIAESMLNLMERIG